MTLQGIHGEQYKIGHELGRGGEGQVFDVLNHGGLVFKRYTEPLGQAQLAKLRQMVAMRTPAIDAYAAWPRDIVLDENAVPCGFVMKKLMGFVPLHMIFSPMDRKKMFPAKGYNFLVHVARNLATAFHKLHEAGLVVGDVNEGNILISATGLVSFIDCDSFQVSNGDQYFFCEVGVPRYTPPELLSLGSFNNVVRTVNTDSFSLAVLIFQLLFLGRHPFAGRNNLKKDIDEETAIRMREFAYSLDREKKKLTPPRDSFDINNLSADIIAFFHRAFEQDERPVPADWVTALDRLLSDMVTCSVSRLHSYPSKLRECPWCTFRQERGIMYFLDDAYQQASAVAWDIDKFVNGFKVEALEIKKWTGTANQPAVTANPIAWKFRLLQRRILVAYFFLAFITIVGLMGLEADEYFPVFGIACIVAFFAIRRFQPARAKLKDELKKRKEDVEYLKTKLSQLIEEHDNPPDLEKYRGAVAYMEQRVAEFKALPERYKQMKEAMEEQLYEEQLGYYLSIFRIQDYEIQSIGSGRKEALANSGIRTAADISLLNTVKVPGIGPKNQQVLISWQRQMASGFTYIPDASKAAQGLVQVDAQLQHLKLQLESDIRREYQSLHYFKTNINSRSIALERQISDHYQQTALAEAELAAFKKFAWTV